MDLWVVAAAAGAGYLSKRLQNLSLSEKEKLVESYSKISNLKQSGKQNFLQQIWDETCHLRRLARKGVHREPSSEKSDVLDRPLEMDQIGGDSDSAFGIGRASTSGNVRMVEDASVLRLSNLSPGFSGGESCPHNMEFMDASSWKSCRVCKYKLLKSRPSGHALGRFGSIESNLEKVDEYVYNSLPTPPIPFPTMRPLLVTDANRNIGRYNCHSFDSSSIAEEDTSSGTCCNENHAFSSAPFLESVGLQEQAKQKTSQEGMLCEAFQSSGPPSWMLLFLIGLTIGIMPEVFSCSREFKELNEKLKQAENLIQDLQEELDMKYKLTVKELAEEHSQPLSTKFSSSFNDEPTMSCSDPCANGTTSYDSKTANNEENRQSMNQIEAELEAELERLGLNMDLERTSDIVELDRHCVDIIQGDIKLDAATRRKYENASESESDEESGNTNGRTPPANYAVSPRELSIRLHKVIESRLKARIKELETALQNNQNKFHSLESQCITSLGPAYSDGESLSIPESPRQLSGNAIDTEDEVKGGTDKITGKDPDTNYAAYNRKTINPDVPPFETKLDDIPNCRNYGFITSLAITEGKRSSSILSDELRPWKEQLSRSIGSNEVCEFEER